MSPAPQRLQKLIADAGLASRRTVEKWIEAGRVTVNGRTAALGDRATITDQVCLDGKLLALARSETPARRVIMYHKPLGEVTTRSDPQRRPTVFKRLPKLKSGRWISIGRLDVMTSGLLLFTTDGALAHRLMHPSSEVEREYVAEVRGRPKREVLDRLLRSVQLDDGPARFDRVSVESSNRDTTTVRVVLREGRKREVRRLWSAVGHEVIRLTRVRYGPIELPGDLQAGEWREVASGLIDRLGTKSR